MPIPVTVLTGFLGSGKTTLLRHVLKAPHGLKIAVIQNEFADEMGIEAPTLMDSDGKPVEGFMELPNGCICCSAKDDFIAAIDALMNAGAAFDYIMVESTGLADPEAVIRTFWVDEHLGSTIFLDAVICLADSARLEETLAGDLKVLAHKQIYCADLVVCNKTDLHLAPIETIRSINPMSGIIEAQYGNLPLENLLNLRAFDAESSAKRLRGLGHDHHSIRSLILKPECVLCPDKVERWLSEVLWEHVGGHVIRAKAIFRGPSESVHQMQAVGDLFEVTEVTTKIEDIESKFLFLGDDLSETKLREGLASCA
eukprot:GEMP01045915.1.p1 GENE.GEMP01045915.1~~GEMP01045915.1.p1  ORF type:complete len:312 (+),score=73.90 GEMP01045915.1:301-1236(+)